MNEDLIRWEATRDQYCLEAIKTNLSLSSGTFIVSLGYIAQQQVFCNKWLIYISWFLLICSIVVGLESIDVGRIRYDVSLKGKTNQLSKSRKKLYEQGKSLKWYESITPEVQRITFYFGLLLFFMFILINSAFKFK